MSIKRTKDPRNAISSWSGYNYQGQVAIIVALETVISNREQIDDCSVGLEDLEDFSIYCADVMKSTHQVKATNGKKVSNYAEALYYMAKSLQSEKANPDTIAYLHTREYVDLSNWEEDVKTEIEKYIPGKQAELKSICNYNLALEKEVEKLREKYRKYKKFKTSKSPTWREIYKLMDDVEKDEDITKENLKNAIETYLSTLQPINLTHENLLKRIKYYKYSCIGNIEVDETRNYIEKLVEIYWGNELSNQRKGSEISYRWRLQELIDQYVVEQHVGTSSEDNIEFSKIIDILNEQSLGTEEYRILRNKDTFFYEMEKYCRYNCENEDLCEECDLNFNKDWINKLPNKELKNAFYMMSPDISRNIKEHETDLLNVDGLANCFFYILSEMKESKIKDGYKVTYSDDSDLYMLTDLYITQMRKKSIYSGLTVNETIESICNDILNNREIAIERMEIDAMISGNIVDGRIEIEKLCPNISKGGANSHEEIKKKEFSYLKITNKKNTVLVDAELFLEEHEAMRREK